MIGFLWDIFIVLLSGLPMTLQLAVTSASAGVALALPLALMLTSRNRMLRWGSNAYVLIFRGTPVLVVLFLTYYGLSQFAVVRHSILWPILREPYWCAVLALSLTTAAFGAEILKGGIEAVPPGEIEAGRSFGMSPLTLLRRVILPSAVRQTLPAYGNELTLAVKATSLASIITLLEVTGLAARLISETFRPLEVLFVAGSFYLLINFTLTRLIAFIDRRMTRHLRPFEPDLQKAGGRA